MGSVDLDDEKLAIDGGRPVREATLPYGRHQIAPEDVAAVCRVLESGWLTTGPEVDAFERDLARRVGAAHAVSVSSGTAALHLALLAAGIGPGDEVVTTPLTFCASANAALYVGATPVFCDVDERTLILDPDRLRDALSPRTRAVVAVGYAGHPVPLAALREVVGPDVVLIEDAAHALGASLAGVPVGAAADLTTFSFHPVKHVAAGEGGAVSTADPELDARLRRLRNHGLDRDLRQRQQVSSWHYDMLELGFNYRLSDLGAALARSQLARLDQNLATRERIAGEYARALARPELVLPSVEPDARSAWHIYPVRVRLDPPQGRDRFVEALRAEGIGAVVHYPPVHLLHYYRERFGHASGRFPVAEAAGETLATLPLHAAMDSGDRDDVVRAVHKVLDALAR